MDLDFSVVAIDANDLSTPKDIGCYVHMDGSLLDVITPIREKIGLENTLSLSVSDRPSMLKLIVKRMGDMEEFIGSSSIPVSVFTTIANVDFKKIWVKLSDDSENDLFIPNATEEIDQPRLLVAYRAKPTETQVIKLRPASESEESESERNQRLQQSVWKLEAELEIMNAELAFEQEKNAKNATEDLINAENRIKELEKQLKAAIENPSFLPSPKAENSGLNAKYNELLNQYRTFLENQKTKDQNGENYLNELIKENANLRSEMVAKQHQIGTLVNEISYLKQEVILAKAEKADTATEKTEEMSTSKAEISVINEEMIELQQKIIDLEAENAKLRKNVESLSQPKPGTESVKTPHGEGKSFSPKKPNSELMESNLNLAAIRTGVQGKLTRVVEGVYLLGNRRIHLRLQGGNLVAQIGGSADWLPIDELLLRIKEEGESKSMKRSISVGQEIEAGEGQITPRKGKQESEDTKSKPALKIRRDFSPILKKKK